ncbi:hypothetical protein PPERSA_00669 [Pseudocohnilembus persalinus]|uniref:TLDc domain-containing protein n=1 Tax=Pseudocohnilembus persalinus TaxID=266149 RepID=A0A0V0QTX1_PSEPJ|nr:hypothetical protein PPERSA_00669 [Pseudocohnilembus persalinus]|eukprot:KRX05368.1 hypothetical protein PPERSA_00669 [Pseudocohnilembus persalinus]
MVEKNSQKQQQQNNDEKEEKKQKEKEKEKEKEKVWIECSSCNQQIEYQDKGEINQEKREKEFKLNQEDQNDFYFISNNNNNLTFNYQQNSSKNKSIQQQNLKQKNPSFSIRKLPILDSQNQSQGSNFQQFLNLKTNQNQQVKNNQVGQFQKENQVQKSNFYWESQFFNNIINENCNDNQVQNQKQNNFLSIKINQSEFLTEKNGAQKNSGKQEKISSQILNDCKKKLSEDFQQVINILEGQQQKKENQQRQEIKEKFNEFQMQNRKNKGEFQKNDQNQYQDQIQSNRGNYLSDKFQSLFKTVSIYEGSEIAPPSAEKSKNIFVPIISNFFKKQEFNFQNSNKDFQEIEIQNKNEKNENLNQKQEQEQNQIGSQICEKDDSFQIGEKKAENQYFNDQEQNSFYREGNGDDLENSLEIYQNKNQNKSEIQLIQKQFSDILENQSQNLDIDLSSQNSIKLEIQKKISDEKLENLKQNYQEKYKNRSFGEIQDLNIQENMNKFKGKSGRYIQNKNDINEKENQKEEDIESSKCLVFQENLNQQEFYGENRKENQIFGEKIQYFKFVKKRKSCQPIVQQQISVSINPEIKNLEKQNVNQSVEGEKLQQNENEFIEDSNCNQNKEQKIGVEDLESFKKNQEQNQNSDILEAENINQDQEDNQFQEEINYVKSSIKQIGFKDFSNLINLHKMQANNIIFTDQCPELVKNYLIELIVKRNRKIKISQISQQEIQEQIEKLQNQGEKSQISDFNIKFQGKNQLEIQKQLEFYQKNLNFQVFLINKGGDLLKADFLGGNCENKFLELLQFFDPPQVIKAENEGVRFLDKIQFLRENKRLVFTFIPEKHVYNSDYRRNVESEFDSFGKQFNNLDVEEMEERFRKAKYLDVSSNCEYFLIRNAQLAEVLGVGKDEIGEIYHLKVGNKFNNFDTSVKYFKKDICLSKIEKDVNDERDQQVKGKQLPLQIVNEKILNKNLEYINFVQEESEMVNQLRISQKLGNSKFLVYYQTQELEEEYERKLFRKLINFKKKIGQIDKNLKDIQIIYSNNADLVQKYFGICVPDRFSSDFYKDTVRFIDSGKKVNLGEINENQKLKNLQVISLDEKPGCTNCYTAQQGVEEFSKIMEEITFKLKNYELKKEEYKEFDMENVINKLRIYNKEVLKDVKVYRYNVYNECIQFPSPSATPLFILVPKNSVKLGIQPIIFDLQKDRVNFNQKDQVVKYLVRKLEDSLDLLIKMISENLGIDKFFCNDCNQNFLNQQQIKLNYDGSESKEEELECYYCFKKYNNIVEAKVLFMGKPACLNCKNNQPEKLICISKQIGQQQYQYQQFNSQKTPSSVNNKSVSINSQKYRQMRMSGNQGHLQRLNSDQKNEVFCQNFSNQLFQSVDIGNRQRRETMQERPNREKMEQLGQEKFSPIIEEKMQHYTANKNHYRSNTLQQQYFNSNPVKQQQQISSTNLNSRKNNQIEPINEEQIQENSQILEKEKVNKLGTKEQRVLKLLGDFQENGYKYLQKKCIFRYSDYKGRSLVSQKFLEKIDKKQHIIILVKINSGMIFGVYLNEQIDKKSVGKGYQDKLACFFSQFGEKQDFYAIQGQNVVLTGSGLSLGKPEIFNLNFDQLNLSKLEIPLCYVNPLGKEETFRFGWNTSWNEIIQEIYVFKS